ncbi:hypothetical protein B0H11DRAFT_1902706 [Mycena galericulata]|nr:hypothetical protein B0H11DRAFT_1902706 [Mycena galericulata]
MPKVPKPEILHSGSYWQDLRRQKQERDVRRRRALEQGPISLPADVGRVVTLPPPPSASRAKRRPVVTTNSITNTVLASRARDDERLLAALTARKLSSKTTLAKMGSKGA